jgi:hypothetical protein
MASSWLEVVTILQKLPVKELSEVHISRKTETEFVIKAIRSNKIDKGATGSASRVKLIGLHDLSW